MPPTPHALLFDWDNTLVDGWAAIAEALNAVFHRRAMPAWTAEQARRNVRGSLRDTFPAMFGPTWQQDAALFYATLDQVHLQVLRPLAGTQKLLHAAAARPCAVVSNKSGPILRREVVHLGWQHFFGAVIGAGDAAADKPDPAPLHLALSRLGAPPGPQVWYVGDTALDMQAARAAGCTAVLLGDAAHDGGVAHAAPDLHLPDAPALHVLLATLA